MNDNDKTRIMRLGIAEGILKACIQTGAARYDYVGSATRKEWMDGWSRRCLEWADAMIRADAEMFPSDSKPASAGEG